MLVGDLQQAVDVAFIRHAESDVHHDGFDDDGGDLAGVRGKQPLDGRQIVERRTPASSMMMAAISPGCAANSRSMAGRLLNGATSVASEVPLSTPALDTTGVGFSGSPNSFPLGFTLTEMASWPP